MFSTVIELVCRQKHWGTYCQKVFWVWGWYKLLSISFFLLVWYSNKFILECWLLQKPLSFLESEVARRNLDTDYHFSLNFCCKRLKRCVLLVGNLRKTFMHKNPVREKCSNTQFFLVRIFLYSDLIRRFTEICSTNSIIPKPKKTLLTISSSVFWTVNQCYYIGENFQKPLWLYRSQILIYFYKNACLSYHN